MRAAERTRTYSQRVPNGGRAARQRRSTAPPTTLRISSPRRAGRPPGGTVGAQGRAPPSLQGRIHSVFRPAPGRAASTPTPGRSQQAGQNPAPTRRAGRPGGGRNRRRAGTRAAERTGTYSQRVPASARTSRQHTEAEPPKIPTDPHAKRQGSAQKPGDASPVSPCLQSQAASESPARRTEHCGRPSPPPGRQSRGRAVRAPSSVTRAPRFACPA